ncbi:autotransporter outer membrane beta-barrel domain-containing protein [Phaeovibrio sulfidiphilus]|uniref:Autotransporter outer membrane beta-barrel domain-containing protein n=1 Tax=Phaeovibrio sulfidiphilus TaxID=1220600 RepID=A0A8J7CQP0_9PROT|nr:autotransporter outer membrane beta-barrel domain-containing protein [Phaeovibrio sulfidiphilus]MBE1237035.1 autotransporter outer membrane beta-barrel domain-containing protein [Phaeovibrio sulfidiphilus]
MQSAAVEARPSGQSLAFRASGAGKTGAAAPAEVGTEYMVDARAGMVMTKTYEKDLVVDRRYLTTGDGTGVVEVNRTLRFGGVKGAEVALQSRGEGSGMTVRDGTRVEGDGRVVVAKKNTVSLGDTWVAPKTTLELRGPDDVSLGAGSATMGHLILEKESTIVLGRAHQALESVSLTGLTLVGAGSLCVGDVPLAIAPSPRATLTLVPDEATLKPMLVMNSPQSGSLTGHFARIDVATPQERQFLAGSVKATGSVGAGYRVIEGYEGTLPAGLGFEVAGERYTFVVTGGNLVLQRDAAYDGKYTDTYERPKTLGKDRVWIAGGTGDNTSDGGSDFSGGLREVRFRGDVTLEDGARAEFRSAPGKDLAVTFAADLRGAVLLDASPAPGATLMTSITRLDATGQDASVTLRGVAKGETRIAGVALAGGHSVRLSRDDSSTAPFLISGFHLGDGGGRFDFSHPIQAETGFFALDLTVAPKAATGSDVLFRASGSAGFSGVTAASFVTSEASRRALATGANRGGSFINVMDGLPGATGGNPLGFGSEPLVAPAGDGTDSGEYVLSSVFAHNRLVAYVSRLEVGDITYASDRRFDPVYGRYTEVVQGVMTLEKGVALDYSAVSDDRTARLDLSGARGVSVSGFGNRLKVGPGSKIDLAGKALTFLIDAPVDLAVPMLAISSPGAVSLAGAQVYLDATAAGSAAFDGDGLTLLSLDGGGLLDGEIAKAVLRDGLVQYSGLEVLKTADSRSLLARFGPGGGAPDTSGGHGYILGAFATGSVLRSAADALAEAGGTVVPLPGTEVWWNGEYEGVGFATLRGYRETLEPASEVRTTGFSFAGGAGVRWNHDAGPLAVLAVLEGGRGSYDIEHTFAGFAASGGGKVMAMGGGLLARQDFLNRLYLEASLRAGRVENEYHNHGVAGGRDVTLRSAWFGAHVAAGYEIPVYEDIGSLDLSARLLWTRIGSGSGDVGSGQRVRIDASDSLRLQAGLRYTQVLASQVRGFVGVVLEQETDGEVTGSVVRANGQGVPLPPADLKGTTALFEGGVNWHLESGLTLDARLFGSVGERESIGGRVSANVAF